MEWSSIRQLHNLGDLPDPSCIKLIPYDTNAIVTHSPDDALQILMRYLTQRHRTHEIPCLSQGLIAIIAESMRVGKSITRRLDTMDIHVTLPYTLGYFIGNVAMSLRDIYEPRYIYTNPLDAIYDATSGIHDSQILPCIKMRWYDMGTALMNSDTRRREVMGILPDMTAPLLQFIVWFLTDPTDGLMWRVEGEYSPHYDYVDIIRQVASIYQHRLDTGTWPDITIIDTLIDLADNAYFNSPHFGIVDACMNAVDELITRCPKLGYGSCLMVNIMKDRGLTTTYAGEKLATLIDAAMTMTTEEVVSYVS